MLPITINLVLSCSVETVCSENFYGENACAWIFVLEVVLPTFVTVAQPIYLQDCAGLTIVTFLSSQRIVKDGLEYFNDRYIISVCNLFTHLSEQKLSVNTSVCTDFCHQGPS